MMNRNTFWTILGLCVILVCSCEKSLNLTPTSSISAASFWETQADAQGGLAGMYDQFRVLGVFSGNRLFLMGAARSEIMDDPAIRNANLKTQYFKNTINASDISVDWTQPYKVISTANNIIANVPDIKFSDNSEKNRILAQAYAMRAYMYFVLARTWGDVPIITEPIKNFDAKNTNKERLPVDQVFSRIKDDIKQALSLFPDNQFPQGRGQWSKPAANVLKGKVYLWTGKKVDGGTQDFTMALAALEDAENADVQLLDNYSDIFDYNNKGNKEVIFAMHFEDVEANNNVYNSIYPQLAAIKESNEKTIERLTPGGWGSWAASKYAADQFDEDDIRKDATIYPIYTYSDSGNDSTFYTEALVKYDGLVDGNTRKFLDDIIIYRYGDLLLLKAEAKNALGQDPSTEMNMIRKRAYGENYNQHIFTSTTQEENDKVILQERLFELGWEGTRWWDLVRFGKAYELVPSLQGRENEVPLLFPVSEDILTRNAALTQTPGY